MLWLVAGWFSVFLLKPPFDPLCLQVEDKVDDNVGCIIAVQAFKHFGAGHVQFGQGSVLFHVNFSCLVFRPEVRRGGWANEPALQRLPLTLASSLV